MTAALEELDRRFTPLGELSLLRRRVDAHGGATVYEIRLAGEFLMSSLVRESEVALADLALAGPAGGPRDVLVGGLGLGYTAKAALDTPGVRSVTVVEVLAPVIEWHVRGMVPVGRALAQDPRCTLILGDFFDLMGAGESAPAERLLLERYHAILIDIDHSPSYLLDPSHAAGYEAAGLGRMARRLHPGGVLAIWSADPPDEAFTARLQAVLPRVETHRVEFRNPLVDEPDANTVYVSRRTQSLT